jgi:hypothetical protein
MHCAVAFTRCEADDIADAAGVFADQYPLAPSWRAGHAWLVADGGRLDEARAIVEEYHLRDRTLEDEALPLCGPHQLGCLAFCLDDVDLARGVVDVLTRHRDRWSHYFLATFGPAALTLGLVKSVLGEHDEAVALMGDALDLTEARGFLDFAGRMRLEFARVLLRRGADGDDDRAREQLAISRARGEQMPAPKLVARVDALLTSLGS